MTKIRIEGLKSIDISLRECFNDDKTQIIGHDSSRNDEFIFLLPVLSPVACKNFNPGENKVSASGFPKQNARRDFIGIQRDFLEG